ncbi:MAG TPA: type II secretion system protein GspM [Gemmatimonadaceae bacterium]|nr:type II secretion system protein GspM [Gemmatimonadaceae bacterium]
MIARPRFPALATRDVRALRLGAWVLLPALAATLVVRPAASALLDAREGVARERTLLARERTLVTRAAQVRERLRDARGALDDAAPRLFPGQDAVTASAELARYVGREATESGLDLEQLETETVLGEAGAEGEQPIEDARPDSSLAPLRVSLRAHGDVVAVVAFLHAIEEGVRLLRVERLDIVASTGDESTDAGTLTLTATIRGLAAGRAATPPAAPEPAKGTTASGVASGGEP